jgi:hypothetical protein
MLYRLDNNFINVFKSLEKSTCILTEKGAKFIPFVNSDNEDDNIYLQIKGKLISEKSPYLEFEVDDADLRYLNKCYKNLLNEYQSENRMVSFIDNDNLIVKGRNYKIYDDVDKLEIGVIYDVVIHFRGLVELFDLGYFYLDMIRIKRSKNKNTDGDLDFVVPETINS